MTTKQRKPLDYVTREARRAVEQLRAATRSDPTPIEVEHVLIQLGRRVLRRAARECEKQKDDGPWMGGERGEERRVRFNQGCEWSRDAIRALARGR